ncbi:MAG: iron-only hydrogenase system regulator [Firmicutes bacterium]|nr:iron-only hydrogenase system regulator [Bacillota bacterium]MBR0105107.1 iron-only hydrogenase system regulator [Bacillota bacterium]MBR2593873.1 iron-only hydrogenase system regulator [Bacillota bacterium]
METRVALVGIIVEDINSATEVNSILHEFNQYIIGRMGIPYSPKGINIISVVVDAPGDVISTISGKLGQLNGISSKVLYTKTSK